MNKFGIVRLEDFGIDENVEAEGLIATPKDDLPASIADAFIAANERERGLRMLGARGKAESWKAALDKVSDDRDMVRELVTHGKLPVQIMQTKIVIARTIEQIGRAQSFLGRMLEVEKGRPKYTAKNLNTAKIASGAPFRELVGIPESLHIAEVNGGSEKLLEVKQPSGRDIFLATGSKLIPGGERTKVIERMLEEGKRELTKWAFGTQVLTMSDLFRLAGNLNELQKYFGQELDQMNEIGEIIQQMRQAGQPMDEVKKVIESYEFPERSEEFTNALGHLNRSLSLVEGRMKSENEANNQVLEGSMPESTPQKIMAEDAKRRKQLGLVIGDKRESVTAMISKKYMAIRRG